MVVVISTAAGLAALLTIVNCVCLSIARRPPSAIIRVLARAFSVVALLVSPGLFDTLLMHLDHSSGISYVAIDPGWSMKLAPAIMSLVITAVILVRSHSNYSQHSRGQ